ncbi:uncharacterized protein B0J16DRAFT_476 [Fusarium flagelliforme]|uniref:uncharacterized protein n=1 Tax=Fusarium flagelliforme TaxID=2675880 RepID=UPI001E8D25A5|nr:uncharacterized protein B0J16DRAFT_476 [Fusarium flagelliforme]KAH7196402.1 hypothetical protein B0J16DRAFT_476 [Fusarium flagelliforme]
MKLHPRKIFLLAKQINSSRYETADQNRILELVNMPFEQGPFDKAVEEKNDFAIEGVGQTIHWVNCNRAFQRKCGGGAWFGMKKEGGSVKVLPGYSVYFDRGAKGQVRTAL